MDARTMTLSLHVATGVAGLVLDPAAMRSLLRPGRDTRVLGLCHWGVATVCATGVALAGLDWSKLWWFVPIAVGSYTFAAVAYLPARFDWRGWLTRQVRGVGGSYIALWTAVLVVSASASPVLWFLPTALGTPVVERLSHRVRAHVTTRDG